MPKKKSIEEQARDILYERFPEWETQPSSLSGRFHAGDSMGKHIEKCATIMKHLCDCFNVPPEDRDILIAAALLHDIGKFAITSDVDIQRRGWKWFKATRHCRLESLMKIHGPIGAAVLDDWKIDRKEEIKQLIASHMSHWNKEAPQPVTLYQHLVCLADYLSSRDGDLFTYVEEVETTKDEALPVRSES
jgi:putative nucleotidyltransferase with HDIG domain